jgi:hypothetical protein
MSVVVESVVFLFFFGGAIMASLHKILKRKWQLNGTDSNIPILAENNTGTIPNIDDTRLAEEIIRLQNRNTMEEVQPASSSGNFCADSHTGNSCWTALVYRSC